MEYFVFDLQLNIPIIMSRFDNNNNKKIVILIFCKFNGLQTNKNL